MSAPSALDSGSQCASIMLGEDDAQPSVVHVRDTLMLPPERPARESTRPAFVLAAEMPVYEALARMRGASVQLAVVKDGETICGIVTLADMLKHVLPAGMAAVQAPVVTRAA